MEEAEAELSTDVEAEAVLLALGPRLTWDNWYETDTVEDDCYSQ